MVDASEFNILEWHDRLLSQAVVSTALYNPQTTDDPLNIDTELKLKSETTAWFGLAETTQIDVFSAITG